MAKSPYYSIVVKETGQDISSMVSRLSHEDAVDVDNLLTLEISTNQINNIERNNIVEGNILIFQYGFLRGKTSPKYMARIVDLPTTYGNSVSIRIIATDLGILLKKNESKKIWENMTSSQIVDEIAQTNGLIAVVDATTTVHDFMPQSGRTDYQLLKYLAERETDGSYRFYLRDNKIHFTKLDLTKDSIRTFTYGDSEGSVISFKPSSRESTKKGSSRNTVVNSIDPFTNEVIQEQVDNDTSSDDTKLGDYLIHFNENGERQEATIPSKYLKQSSDQNRSGKSLDLPVSSVAEAKNLANKEKKGSSLNDVTAYLNVEGDPDYVADEIITIGGVQKRDLGNWFVKRANHTIAPGAGYSIKMSLQKNALAKVTNTDDSKQINTNKASGPESGSTKKEVNAHLYDSSGDEIKN